LGRQFGLPGGTARPAKTRSARSGPATPTVGLPLPRACQRSGASGRGPGSPRRPKRRPQPYMTPPAPLPNPNRNPHPFPTRPRPRLPSPSPPQRLSGRPSGVAALDFASPPRPSPPRRHLVLPPSILPPHLVLARLLISVHRVVVILAAVLRRACLFPSLRRRAPALQASTSSSRPQPLSLTLAV